MSASPYGSIESLTVSVPVAANRSQFTELGPLLTKNVIDRLDGASSIIVQANAPAKLSLTINNVAVSGGAWDVTDYENKPIASASRVLSVAVTAVLEKPGVSGKIIKSQKNLYSSRTFLVGSQQADVAVLENEALQWVINDLSQKIAQSMFSEF